MHEGGGHDRQREGSAQMIEEFARRDVVYLLSGGAAMTVKNVTVTASSYSHRGPLVECTWFEGKRLREKTFFADLLTKTDPKKPVTVQQFVPPMHNETPRDRD